VWSLLLLLSSLSLLLRTMKMFLRIDLFLKTVNTGIMDCSGSWLGLGLGLGLSEIEAIGRKEKKAGAEGWEKWEREESMCLLCYVLSNGYFLNKRFLI
jgi:hypothetical protein